MAIAEPIAAVPKARRWFHLTPGKFLVVLLAVEGGLLLSKPWFPKGWAVLMAIVAVAVTIVLMFLWFAVAFVCRWRFQFSIRSLLLLTVVIAVSSSWLAVEMKWAKEQRETVETLIKLGDIVEYEVELDSSGQNMIEKQPSCPAWVRKVLSDDFFKNVTTIMCNYEKVTDVDLKPLEGLKQIDTLYLSHASITDAGLEHLEGLKQIGVLHLSKTTITDAGLEYIKELKKLKWIDLRHTQVTEAGIAELQKALPNCKIEH